MRNDYWVMILEIKKEGIRIVLVHEISLNNLLMCYDIFSILLCLIWGCLLSWGFSRNCYKLLLGVIPRPVLLKILCADISWWTLSIETKVFHDFILVSSLAFSRYWTLYLLPVIIQQYKIYNNFFWDIHNQHPMTW